MNEILPTQRPGEPDHTIEAVAFRPSSETESRRRLTPWHFVIMVLVAASVFIFWFLFTSKSVQLKFSPGADSISVEGGISFELGGVWLLREGNYTVSANRSLHHPLSTDLRIGSERNQVFELEFTPLPGYLAVKSEPQDAVVEIDGISVTATTPIEAGTHELRVRHPRYLPYKDTIEIEGRETTQHLEVALTRNWANVGIVSDPAGATVLIDNEPWPSRTPVTIEALAGEREIAVTLDGFKSFRQRIFAQSMDDFELPPIRLQQADALMRITSTPDASGVLLNGQFVGQTPLELDLTSAATHRIQVVRGGYREWQRSVRLEPGQSKPIHANLARQTGTVNITVEPVGALLKIDESSITRAEDGRYSLSLPVREHRLDLSLDGYAGYAQTITPRSGLAQEIKVRLLTVEEARLAAMKPTIQAPDGQTLKLFEPFDFRMGASRREPGRRANETLRDVGMSRLFYLATHETTNAQFRAFASGHDSGKYVESDLNQDEQPVVNLSWDDAAAYCNWLSDQAGLPRFYVMEFGKVVDMNRASKGFRLPTEAEWSWAARTLSNADDAEQLRFPWGAQLPPPDRHGNYADRSASNLVGRVVFGYNDNYTAAAPVGTYQANHRGLYDLGGNVSEWVNDYYEIPKSGGAEPQDPTGPLSGEYHTIKGSSWMHGTITELRLSFRDYGVDGRQDVGFRIARYAE